MIDGSKQELVLFPGQEYPISEHVSQEFAAPLGTQKISIALWGRETWPHLAFGQAVIDVILERYANAEWHHVLGSSVQPGLARNEEGEETALALIETVIQESIVPIDFYRVKIVCLVSCSFYCYAIFE